MLRNYETFLVAFKSDNFSTAEISGSFVGLILDVFTKRQKIKPIKTLSRRKWKGNGERSLEMVMGFYWFAEIWYLALD